MIGDANLVPKPMTLETNSTYYLPVRGSARNEAHQKNHPLYTLDLLAD